MPKIKKQTIITILIIVMISNIIDFVMDINNAAPWWHIMMESLVITLAMGLIVYLFIELKQKKRHLAHLATELKSAEQSLNKSEALIRNARKEYGMVIHQQFDQWQLTESQQQIALLLLKGLSFQEIASIRETKEKTVRQQASEIYKKTGIEGRHAFSAWFFEDFLN